MPAATPPRLRNGYRYRSSRSSVATVCLNLVAGQIKMLRPEDPLMLDILIAFPLVGGAHRVDDSQWAGSRFIDRVTLDTDAWTG